MRQTDGQMNDRPHGALGLFYTLQYARRITGKVPVSSFPGRQS